MSEKSDGGLRRRKTDPPPDPCRQFTPSLDATLEQVVAMGASDLHITSGIQPTVRVSGILLPIPDTPVMTPEMTECFVTGTMTAEQLEEFEREGEIDFAFGRRGVGRYRVNAFRERGDVSAAMRRIPDRPIPLDTLGLPAIVSSFAQLSQGLVILTGPTGSGKSTTLAGLIDKINRERRVHIITIEDPIEYLHTHQMAIVQQRELGRDTNTFARALSSALREDPDVILIGEMRDPQTMAAAVSAAETGHLVFTTLHTNSAAQSVDRIIDMFAPHQQKQIRMQLAASLQAIVSQRLLPSIDGGLACVAEVLIATTAVRNLIRESKTHQLESVMPSGVKEGMVIFDVQLAELVRSQRISHEVAMTYCTDQQTFDTRLRAYP